MLQWGPGMHLTNKTDRLVNSATHWAILFANNSEFYHQRKSQAIFRTDWGKQGTPGDFFRRSLLCSTSTPRRHRGAYEGSSDEIAQRDCLYIILSFKCLWRRAAFINECLGAKTLPRTHHWASYSWNTDPRMNENRNNTCNFIIWLLKI